MEVNLLERGRFFITRIKIFRMVNLLAAVASLFYIAWAGAEVKKYFEKDIICVMPVINDNSYYFKPEDIEALEESECIGAYATERMVNTVVMAGQTRAFAKMAAVSPGYFDIYRMQFINGGLWGKGQASERFIVLSESLAWTLFGNVNAVGLTVTINDEEYTVTGVAAQGDVSKNNGFCWVPQADNADTDTGAVMYKHNNYNLLDAHIDTEALLSSMNRNPRDYTITDLNVYAESVAMRGRLLLFLFNLYFLVLIVLHIFRLGRNTAKKKEGIWVFILFTVISAAAVVFIANRAAFELWVPAFAGEGIKGYAQALFNYGLLAPQRYLSYNLSMLQSINQNANIAFGIGVAGLTQFAVLHYN